MNALPVSQNVANRHHTCLPCQREVDWRQGTNHNIIAFTCDMLTIFILQTFLPSRRRDCHFIILYLTPTLPKPYYPSKITITLALLAPPVAPNTAIPTTIEKNHNPSLSTFPTNQKDRTSSQVRSYLF